MALSKNNLIHRIAWLTLLSSLSIISNNLYASDPQITICHYPSGDIANPVTTTIARSEWANHRANHGDATHRDMPGACGILAGKGCFTDNLTFYGMNDDFNGIAVYNIDNANVVSLTPNITFPDELESLTQSQGETYYAIESGGPESKKSIGFFQITLKQNADGTFSGDYLKILDMKPGSFKSIELIDGDFYIAHNKQNKWIIMSLDGTILAERSFKNSMATVPKNMRNKGIEDTAYDPVNKILYASHLWDSDMKGGSHLLAFDLSNGFDNMVAVDKGTMYWEKIEGLIFKNGSLYAASDHDDKLFKIIQDGNGNIVGEGKGEEVIGWYSTMSSDIEGMASAFLTNSDDCPQKKPSLIPLNFGSQGRFNVRCITGY